MATYQETIELVDNVSGPANAAAASLKKVGAALANVNKALVSFGSGAGTALADKFADALGRILPVLERLAAIGSVKLPKLQTDEQKFTGYLAALTAVIPVLERLKAIGAVSLPKVPGSAPAGAPAPKALAAAGTPVAVAKGGPIKVEADTVNAAAQFKTLSSSVKAAEGAMVTAAAKGDQPAFEKAAASAQQFKDALSALPEGAEKAAGGGKSIERTLWNARNAMDVGRQSIGAAVEGMKSAFASLAQGNVKGVIEGITQSIAGMARMLNLVVPGLGEAVAAVVSIAGGLAGALASITVGGAKFAIQASQAKQQMLSLFDAMGGGVVSGEQLDEMLSGLADRIGISKDTLAPLTEEFLRMGVTGVDSLEKLTLAAMSAEASGKGGAAAFTELQKKLQLAVETGQGFKLGTKQLLGLRAAGAGVSEIAAKMGMTTAALTAALAAGTVDAKKFGDAMTEAVIAKGAKPLERMATSFDAIKKKWDQDIGDLFEDIDVGPFMAEVKELFSIFGQGKSSGEALKAGIGGFFKEVFSLATKLVPIAKHFLLDLVIYGLRAYIALKPIVGAIREFFASATGSAVLQFALDTLWSALKGIGLAIAVVVGFFATMAAVSMAVGVAVWSAIGALASLAITIGSAVTGAISGAVAALMGWVSGAGQVASDFVMGLVNGITAGASLVTNAVQGLASGALNSFKGILGIASPSKVMAGMGSFTAQGFAQGVEGGAPDVHGAASGLASAAVSGVQSSPPGAGGAVAAAASAGQAGSSTDNSKSVTIEHIEVVIQGAGKGLQEVTAEMWASVTEQLALQAGAA
jgi:hypothetical protein